MKDVNKKDSNIIIDLFKLFQDFKGHKIVQKKKKFTENRTVFFTV